jgi:presequence protease
VRLTLSPDPRLAEERDARERRELEAIGRRLTPADLERLRVDAEALRRLQDTVEDVSSLPTLERGDIPPAVEVIAPRSVEESGRIAVYEQATSGILYVAAAAGAGGLPAEMVDAAPFFCHAFSRIGTTRRDYAEMARRIDAVTGGIGLAASPRTGFDGGGECIPFIALNAKCLNRNLAPTADILAELLGQYDFSDLTRLKRLLLEYRAGLEAMVIHNGHRLAMSLAARRFSIPRLLSEQWSGIHHLRHVKQISDGLSDASLAELAARLTESAGASGAGRTSARPLSAKPRRYPAPGRGRGRLRPHFRTAATAQGFPIAASPLPLRGSGKDGRRPRP